MSIERDKDFEQLEDIAAMMAENPGIEFENGKYVYYGLDPRTAFAVVYIGGAWSAWQAKANAVPEGFVLIPKKLPDELNDQLWDFMTDNFVCVNDYGDSFMACDDFDLDKFYAELVEAQESK
jgi:hypothetical protein